MPDEVEQSGESRELKAPPVAAPPIAAKPASWQGQPQPQTDPTMGGLIPVNNPKALTSYYLGLFSIFPFFGVFLGGAALWLGKQGLDFNKEHPEAKGGTHAKIGIGCGLCGLLMNLFFIIVIVAAVLSTNAK